MLQPIEKQPSPAIPNSIKLEQLKKIFTFPKKGQFPERQHQDSSLLFAKKSPLCIIKAYRNSKKTYLDESNYKQFYSSMNQSENNSFIQKKKLNLYETKEIILNTKIYDDIIKKIQNKMSKNNQNMCNQRKYKKNSMIEQVSPERNQDKQGKKDTLLYNSKRPLVDSSVDDVVSKFNTYKELAGLDKCTIKRSNIDSKAILNSKEDSLNENTVSEVHGGQQKFLTPSRNSVTNGHIQSIEQKSSTKLPIIPHLRNSQSFSSLIGSQGKKTHTSCYMKYHLQARKFIFSNRQNLSLQPKIKDFLITGVSASNYAVVDFQTLTLITCKNYNKKIQIASVSKIMTCYLALLVAKKYKIDFKKYQARVSENAIEMTGTSAEFQVGDNLTIEDLLYALMLPSGNDASVVVAEVVGKIIQKNKKKSTTKTYYQTFIAHMNILSRELGLDQTWRNSSGLAFNPNYSSPKAVCCLTVAAMMDERFRSIVSSQTYSTQVKNDRFGLKRKVLWENTNKLLSEKWEGVKTGITDAAGACLVAKKGRYLIAVFNSKNTNSRFTDCQQLYNFLKQRERIIFPQKWD